MGDDLLLDLLRFCSEMAPPLLTQLIPRDGLGLRDPGLQCGLLREREAGFLVGLVSVLGGELVDELLGAGGDCCPSARAALNQVIADRGEFHTAVVAAGCGAFP